MKLSRSRLLAVVAILLVAGLGIAGYLLVSDDDDEDPDDVALGTTTTTGDDDPVLTTTTTDAPGGQTTSTTLRQATTTTTSATTTTAPGGSTTTTTRPPTGVCGTGTARVTIAARDLTTTATESAFVPEARVENLISRPIEVDVLAAEIAYPDGSTRLVTFPTAGVVIAPSATHTYAGDRQASAAQYTSARVSNFAYFTSGQRERCRISL